MSTSNHKLRIAHLTDVIDGRSNSGTARVAKEIIDELGTNIQIHQTFIHFDNSQDSIYSLPNSQDVLIPFWKFGVANHFFSFLIFWVRNLFTKEIKEFDVVHWHSSRVYPFYYLIPSKKHIISLYDATNRIVKEVNTIWTRIFFWNLRISVSRLNYIIGTSVISCKNLSRFGKFPKNKIKCIYLASNFDNLMATMPNGFSSHDDYFLCVSRWQPYKNVAKLVHAYHLANRQDSRLPKLILEGKPVASYEEPLRLIKEYRLEHKIQVLSDLSDNELAYLYDHALINISPSLHEGFGLPVLEGLKRQCPSLDHVYTSTSEVSGAAGFHIDMNSLLEIKGALLKISRERGLLDELRLNATKRAREFTWKQTVDRLLEIYSS